MTFWVFLVLKTSFPHYILQSGPHRWGFHTENLAVFPCVSSFANADVAIVFVLCSACAIALTRPTDAGKLKGKKRKMRFVTYIHHRPYPPFLYRIVFLIQNFLSSRTEWAKYFLYGLLTELNAGCNVLPVSQRFLIIDADNTECMWNKLHGR